MNWYVLHVRTGKETAVRDELKRQGLDAEVPTEIVSERKGGKWRERTKTLLPGYVFTRLQLTDEEFYVVKSVPSVIRFLGVGRPEPIRDEEEEYIRWISNNGEPLGGSDILLEEGNRAIVLDGPLFGREGVIAWVNKRQRRVGVAITINGSQKVFSLSVNFLTPTKGGDA